MNVEAVVSIRRKGTLNNNAYAEIVFVMAKK